MSSTTLSPEVTATPDLELVLIEAPAPGVPCHIVRSARHRHCESLDDHLAEVEVLCACGAHYAYCASAWTVLAPQVLRGEVTCEQADLHWMSVVAVRPL